MVKEEIEVKYLWKTVSDICKNAEKIIIEKRNFGKYDLVHELLSKAEKLITSISFLPEWGPGVTEAKRLRADLIGMIRNTKNRIEGARGPIKKHQEDLFNNIIKFRGKEIHIPVSELGNACRNVPNIPDSFRDIRSKLGGIGEVCIKLCDDYKAINSLFQARDLENFIALYSFYRGPLINNFHNHVKELRGWLDKIDTSEIARIQVNSRFTSDQRDAIVRAFNKLKDCASYLKILDESLEAFVRTIE
jgi:hypothetical protein